MFNGVMHFKLVNGKIDYLLAYHFPKPLKFNFKNELIVVNLVSKKKKKKIH